MGRSKTTLYTLRYLNSAVATTTPGYYDNRTVGAELSTEGPLIALPAGLARLAAGAGYRKSQLTADIYTITPTSKTPFNVFDKERRSYYGYAELFVPIIAPAMAVPAIDTLSFSAAVRYENYPGMDKLATPKFGLIYAPIPDLEFRASWGKSFKTPTLYQQFNRSIGYYETANIYGGSASQTTIEVEGGNPNLKAERATTYALTAILKPRVVPGLRIAASYFNIRYKDRIAQPITSFAGLLSNPAYAALVIHNPTSTQIDEVLSQLDGGLSNFTGAPYNPATVTAIIDARFRNIARQRLHGIDLLADYRFAVDGEDHVNLTLAGTYLHSTQQLTGAMPAVDLAGTIFNPPHFKGRAGATWQAGPTALTAFANYTGSVTDARGGIISNVRATTTVDLTLRHQIVSSSGLFHGLGSGLVDHSQKMTVAARAIAEKKAVGQRS